MEGETPISDNEPCVSSSTGNKLLQLRLILTSSKKKKIEMENDQFLA